MVSVVICFTVFAVVYGSFGSIVDNVDGTGLVLPVIAPLIIAPIASGQLSTALGLAAAVIDELEETKAQLERLALHDPLTDLLNRRGFFAAVAGLEAEQLASLLVATADVDEFKSVNDTRGHAIGDRVLIGVARALSEAAGPDAIVARIGGDEFVACLGSDDGDPGRIRRALRAVAVPEVDVVVRCSLGIAGHDVGRSIDATLADADAALYRDKHDGREQRRPAVRASNRS